MATSATVFVENPIWTQSARPTATGSSSEALATGTATTFVSFPPAASSPSYHDDDDDDDDDDSAPPLHSTTVTTTTNGNCNNSNSNSYNSNNNNDTKTSQHVLSSRLPAPTQWSVDGFATLSVYSSLRPASSPSPFPTPPPSSSPSPSLTRRLKSQLDLKQALDGPYPIRRPSLTSLPNIPSRPGTRLSMASSHSGSTILKRTSSVSNVEVALMAVLDHRKSCLVNNTGNQTSSGESTNNARPAEEGDFDTDEADHFSLLDGLAEAALASMASVKLKSFSHTLNTLGFSHQPVSTPPRSTPSPRSSSASLLATPVPAKRKLSIPKSHESTTDLQECLLELEATMHDLEFLESDLVRAGKNKDSSKELAAPVQSEGTGLKGELSEGTNPGSNQLSSVKAEVSNDADESHGRQAVPPSSVALISPSGTLIRSRAPAAATNPETIDASAVRRRTSTSKPFNFFGSGADLARFGSFRGSTSSARQTAEEETDRERPTSRSSFILGRRTKPENSEPAPSGNAPRRRRSISSFNFTLFSRRASTEPDLPTDTRASNKSNEFVRQSLDRGRSGSRRFSISRSRSRSQSRWSIGAGRTRSRSPASQGEEPPALPTARSSSRGRWSTSGSLNRGRHRSRSPSITSEVPTSESGAAFARSSSRSSLFRNRSPFRTSLQLNPNQSSPGGASPSTATRMPQTTQSQHPPLHAFLTSSSTVYTGKLRLQSRSGVIFRAWRTRLFVLTPGYLYFFRSHPDDDAQPHSRQQLPDQHAKSMDPAFFARTALGYIRIDARTTVATEARRLVFEITSRGRVFQEPIGDEAGGGTGGRGKRRSIASGDGESPLEEVRTWILTAEDEMSKRTWMAHILQAVAANRNQVNRSSRSFGDASTAIALRESLASPLAMSGRSTPTLSATPMSVTPSPLPFGGEAERPLSAQLQQAIMTADTVGVGGEPTSASSSLPRSASTVLFASSSSFSSSSLDRV